MENTNKKWAVAISAFGEKYSAVVSYWEINEEGEKVNSGSKKILTNTIEDALLEVDKKIKE
jgi:hypothetical protein